MSSISVLMPVYNGEKYLAKAIKSILWQTWQDWELVIIDDGSQDGSLNCARSFAAQDSRLRVIERPHRGIVETLNEGLRLCSAPWIARMDSDDISAPRRLQRQWEFCTAHTELSAIGSFVRIFPRQGRSLGVRRYERWLNRYWQSEDLARDIFVESPLVHPSVLMRRSDIIEAGGYRDTPWPEDYDLWMRLWIRGRQFAKVPEVLFFWRDTPQRLTRTDARCRHSCLRNLKLHYLMRRYFPQCQPDSGNPPGRPVLVWGAGSNGKDLVKDLRRLGLQVSGFVDSCPARCGQTILGLPVQHDSQARLERGEFVIMAVSNPYFRADIRRRLNDLGAREGTDYVCLANIAK
ncbi:glycosyltransferase [bacterium]|nr:glycosyltransferase [bacterium]